MKLSGRFPLARLLLALALALAVSFGGAPPRATADAETASPVVVIGFSGIRWNDISPENTPNLADFAAGSGSAAVMGANLVVRTIGDTTCPAQGWLTLGAGSRMAEPGGSCVRLEAPSAGAIPGWEAIAKANAKNAYRPKTGLLGESLSGKNAVAIGPGAALALADSEGRLAARYEPVRGEATPEDFARAFTRAAGARADLVVVDAGSVRYSGQELGSEGPASSLDAVDALKAAFRPVTLEPPAGARAAIAEIDARFGALLKRIDAEAPGARVLVVSLANAQETTPQLQFFGAREPGEAGELSYARSASTRQTGLVQLTDLAPTILEALGLPEPAGLPGAAIHPGPSALQLSEPLSDDQVRSLVSRSMVGFFYLALLLLAAIVCFGALRRRKVGHAPEATGQNSAQLAAFAAALPAASLLANLLPWWRTQSPRLSLTAAVAVIAALIALAATARAGRSRPGWPLLAIGLPSLLAPGLDILLDQALPGYPLQLASILGTQPQVGGRFYGLSNATFAVFATGLLLLLSVLATRIRRSGLPDAPTSGQAARKAGRLVLAGGALAAIVDGISLFGADFGGPPALAVAIGVLYFAVRRRPFSLPRAAIVAGAAGATSLAFSVADYLGPASRRSHLGRVVETTLEGGLGSVVSRKVSAIFFGLPAPAAFAALGVLLLLAAAAAIAWRFGALPMPRNRRHEAPGCSIDPALRDVPHRRAVVPDCESSEILRYARLGVLSCMAAGFFINDSGIAIPLVGLAVACPAMVAERLRACGEDADGGNP